MSDDDAFLRAIHAKPGDFLLRLAYADFLDERGDEASLARAEYLRLECELDSKPLQEGSRISRAVRRLRGRKSNWEVRQQVIRERMRDLELDAGYQWLQMIDTGEVGHCITFA